MKVLFNLQRFLILQSKLIPSTSSSIPDSYAYAWYSKVFPFLEDSELHTDLEQFFSIKREVALEVAKFLDNNWVKGKMFNWYELERHYDGHPDIKRFDLIPILHYMYLHNSFDPDFWGKLLEPHQHPIEAKRVIEPFTADEIFLVWG